MHNTLATAGISVFLLGSVFASRADFSGPFALTPPNPGVFEIPGPGPISFGGWVEELNAGRGTVDTSLAPQVLGLGIDQASRPMAFEFITIPPIAQSGIVSFDYLITGQNDGFFSWSVYEFGGSNRRETIVSN